MTCVSGGASKNLLIQQKKVVLSIEHIMPGSLLLVLMIDHFMLVLIMLSGMVL